MTVSIVADSAASLPPDLIQAGNITIVPMLLTINGQTFRDGELPLARVAACDPRQLFTAAPTPGQFVDAIESADTGDGVVVVTVATTMSSALDSAIVAARQVDLAVEVVDSGTAAGGEGLVTLSAGEIAARGAGVSAVAAAARDTAAKVRLVATLDSLEHLSHSGRVPEAAVWAGRWLHLHPMFEFSDGRAHALHPARSRAGALERIFSRWRATRVPNARLHIAALSALDTEPAEELLARIRAETDDIGSAFVASFSAVMIAHTGPGLVGLSWWWEPQPAVS